ncbi:MAG: endonuclease [Legionellales bacterium]|nr:endonuclease [Legionellales bacterium]|tara:strand:- start:877 stop:1122 length:246 start_codon:yes stop_codon:yes gene_type:complete
MNWFVYVLKCADNTLYTGITNNLKSRLIAHQNGQGAKYTKGRGPFEIFYKEKCSSRSIATKRELEIKNLKRHQKLKLKSQI